MKKLSLMFIALAALLSSAAAACAQATPAAPPPEPTKECQVEFYRIAPAQQEEFLKCIAFHADTATDAPTTADEWLKPLRK